MINSFALGGAERLVIDATASLRRRGLEVWVVTIRPEKPGLSLASELEIEKTRWRVLPIQNLFDLVGWFRLVRLLVRLRPLVVVTHLWFANTMGRSAAFVAGVPKIVAFEQNVYDAVKSRRHFAVDRLLARISDAIIAVSVPVRDALRRHGIPAAKIEVIENGIALRRYRRPPEGSPRARLGIPDDLCAFLFAGRLTAQKGVDVLLRSFARSRPGRLVVVGEGEDRSALEALARDLGIREEVRFVGFVPDIREFLWAADCMVLPSRWEGLSIVLLEAMAAGIPVIASRLPAVETVVRDGVEALLVSPEDVAALSGAMKRLAGDAALARSLAEHARMRVEDFSVERHVERLVALLFPALSPHTHTDADHTAISENPDTPFPIGAVARAYVQCRFPRASLEEQERMVRDWTAKVEEARGVVEDFTRRIGEPRGRRILDAGCGNGGTMVAFAEAGAEVFGVEVEPELVAIASRHLAAYGSRAPVVLYDGYALPFSENTFDGALSISVLEHVSDPDRYLGELWRVLKPGGVLYLAFPNRLWPRETHTGLWGITYLPSAAARRLVKAAGRNPLEDNNLHFYTYWSLRRMLGSRSGAGAAWLVRREAGRSRHVLKILVKRLLWFFHVPHSALLPHVMVVLEKL